MKIWNIGDRWDTGYIEEFRIIGPNPQQATVAGKTHLRGGNLEQYQAGKGEEREKGRGWGGQEKEEQKQILRASTSKETNYIGKTKKPFTIGEEFILPAIKDICCYIFGEAVKNIQTMLLWGSTSLGALRK